MARLCITALMLALLQACSPSRSTVSSSEGVPAVPPDLKIVLGDGGGIAGMWNGYTVIAPDSILRWKGSEPGLNPAPAGVLDRDTVLAWWQFIRDQRIMQKPSIRKTANYLQGISILTGESRVDFVWPLSAANDSTIAAMAAFRARCLRTIRRSLNP